jgi:hypothetical protein
MKDDKLEHQRIRIDIDTECHIQLEELATVHNISMSKMVRNLITKAYEEETGLYY